MIENPEVGQLVVTEGSTSPFFIQYIAGRAVKGRGLEVSGPMLIGGSTHKGYTDTLIGYDPSLVVGGNNLYFKETVELTRDEIAALERRLVSLRAVQVGIEAAYTISCTADLEFKAQKGREARGET